MCMQSVSLWAEATWYRIGGGRSTTEGRPAEPVDPALRVESAPVGVAEAEDEKVLVSR